MEFRSVHCANNNNQKPMRLLVNETNFKGNGDQSTCIQKMPKNFGISLPFNTI